MRVKYSLGDSTLGKEAVHQKRNSFLFQSPCAENEKCTYYAITLEKGLYKFEAWGSRGGTWICPEPGLGAYVKGSIYLPEEITLYAYIGTTHFGSVNSIASINRSGPGGGATDVRLEDGDWASFSSMKSRILVAAGGGGCEWTNSRGGNGGIFEGSNGYGSPKPEMPLNDTMYTTGGTQISGGEYFNAVFYDIEFGGTIGHFGYAGFSEESDKGGIGGGGYYAGGSFNYAGGGGGGSSYISGLDGCNSISEDSTDYNHIHHTGKSHHYSGLIFHDIEVFNGNSTMPSYKTSINEVGNSNYGALRITILDFCFTYQEKITIKITILILIFIIIDK